MKNSDRITLTVIFILMPALPLLAWFQATINAEILPSIPRSQEKYVLLVEAGRTLAKPAYVFVEHVMMRIDFMYACAGASHPVFPISFTILSLGYSGALAVGFIATRQAMLRKRFQKE